MSTSGSASVPILDDDAMVSVANASAAEGSAVVFTVTLPEVAPSGGVTVGYSTSDGRGNDDDDAHRVATSADYTAAAESAALSIAAGSRSGTVSIPTAQDTTYEGDHYFTLNLDSTSHFNLSAAADSAVGTITDAADAPSFAFSTASTDADEDDGTLTLTVEKTGTTLVAATVSYATTNGTATGGSDFTAIASTDLDFAAGDASKDITVSVTDDSADESTEAFTVDLTAGAHAQLGSTRSHSIAITDNDATTVTLQAPSTAIDENAGAKTVTVTLGRALEGDETLDVPLTFSGTATFGDDYTLAAPNSTPTGVSYSNLASTDRSANPPTIAFSGVNGAASSATVILTATSDTTDEGASESVTVGIGTIDDDLDGGTTQSGTGTFNIEDDDDAPGGITLTLDQSTIAEDAATATVTVTASVTGGTAYATNKTVKVKVGESGDSAVEGTDYANVADFDLTINAMETSAEKTFSLNPTDDDLDEDTERLSVTGTSGDITVTGANITITDDDDAPTVSVADAAAVNEGNDPNATVNLSFAVTLDAASGKQVTVPYSLGGTATATDDYTEPNPLSVTIAAGSRSASIEVPVKGDTLGRAERDRHRHPRRADQRHGLHDRGRGRSLGHHHRRRRDADRDAHPDPGGHRRVRRRQPEHGDRRPERRDEPGPHPHRRRRAGVPGPCGRLHTQRQHHPDHRRRQHRQHRRGDRHGGGQLGGRPRQDRHGLRRGERRQRRGQSYGRDADHQRRRGHADGVGGGRDGGRRGRRPHDHPGHELCADAVRDQQPGGDGSVHARRQRDRRQRLRDAEPPVGDHRGGTEERHDCRQGQGRHSGRG